MSNDIISAFADAISYFNLTNLQIAFESLKLLNIDFNNTPEPRRKPKVFLKTEILVVLTAMTVRIVFSV